MSEPAVVNGAFIGQAVTGQQRFAHEISRRLPYPVIEPPARLRSSTLGSWAWASALDLHPAVRRSRTMLTLTSRGPVWSRRQVLVVHDLFVLNHPEWYSTRYVQTHAPLLRAQISSAKGIVTVSEPVMEQLQRQFRVTVPTAVVPNAPADVFLTPGDAPRDLEQPMLELLESPFILSVASLDPRKNLRRLIEAYLTLDYDWRTAHPLVLCGGGNSSVFAEDEALAEDETIIRLGYVADETLAWLYRRAGKVVFPALDEGFGLPAVEALASGARLVVSDVPVLRWVCGDAAQYVDPLEITSIANGLVSEPALGEFDASRFSWDSSAAVLRDFISEHFAKGA